MQANLTGTDSLSYQQQLKYYQNIKMILKYLILK